MCGKRSHPQNGSEMGKKEKENGLLIRRHEPKSTNRTKRKGKEREKMGKRSKRRK